MIVMRMDTFLRLLPLFTWGSITATKVLYVCRYTEYWFVLPILIVVLAAAACKEKRKRIFAGTLLLLLVLNGMEVHWLNLLVSNGWELNWWM